MKKLTLYFLFLSFGSLSNALSLETKTIKLKDQESCHDDIERFCPNKKSSNLAVMSCLQDIIPMDGTVSIDCQNLIWKIKSNITRAQGNYVPVKNYALCSADVENLPICKQEKVKGGPYVACLIESMAIVKAIPCLNFLHLLQPLIFTDIRFIYRLADVCSKNIDDFKCGRTKNFYLSEQGTTIDCLSEHLDVLVDECREEVLKLAELQASDWRSDRGLFMACRNDKEIFCPPDLPSDTGLVYKCLFEHKERDGMSRECKAKLRLRQILQVEDYKASYSFYKSCKEDMTHHKCTFLDAAGADKALKGVDSSGVEGDSRKHFEKMKLSMVVLCLEKARVRGETLKGVCLQEMTQVRKQMLQEHTVNPQIMSACSAEVKVCENPEKVRELHTQKLLSSPSHHYVIHCLMDLIRHTPLLQSTPDAVSKTCYYAVNSVLKELGVVDHLEVDLALKYDCALTITQHCPDVPKTDGLMIECLMDLLGTQKIDVECSNRVSEIQFFMARDFNVSTRFWGACQKDLEQLCPAAEMNEDSNKVMQQAHQLSCLYRNYENQLSERCSKEVRMVMVERARSVDLPPEIQEACITDLVKFCPKLKERDEETECLEENYEELSNSCKDEMSKEVNEEEDMPLLTRLFLDACESFWNNHCTFNVVGKGKTSKRKNMLGDLPLSSEDTEDEATYLMECLIKNKNHKEMPKKCRIGVEHHQLVALKHYNTNGHFKRACIRDIETYCASHNDKVPAIKCLSEWVYNDTMTDSKHHVSKKCRKQLTFQVLQTRETENLDDEMRSACKADRKQFCPEVKPGKGAVMRCLRQHQKKLSESCMKLVFEREENEAAFPEMDFTLVSKCKRMLKTYCEDSTEPFICLKKNKDDEEFDEECRKVVVDRMRLRAKDIRLSPKLFKDCHKDIENECADAMKKASEKPYEANDIVIYCLRRVFVHVIRRKHMSESCVRHVTDLLRESSLDDMQDAALLKDCSEAIKSRCVEEAELDKRNFGGTKVESCLKKHLLSDEKFRNENIQCFHEIVQRITESKVDIHVDALLSRLCSLDSKNVCKGVVSGESRVMSCLLLALKEDERKLTQRCRKALQERTELWNKAVELAPPENFAELVNQIHSSSARTFFEILLVFMVVGIFCGGLLCGRITKRISKQMKSK